MRKKKSSLNAEGIKEPHPAPHANGLQPDNSEGQNDEGAPSPRPIMELQKGMRLLQGAHLTNKVISEGKTITELAKEFHLSPETIRRRIADQRQMDFVTVAKEMMAERLLPKAMAILNKELNNGNYEAAKDVLFGLQALQKGSQKVVVEKGNGNILDAIRRERAIEAEVIDKKDEH